MEDVVLKDTTLNPNKADIGKKVEAYCEEKVNMLLDQAGKRWSSLIIVYVLGHWKRYLFKIGGSVIL